MKMIPIDVNECLINNGDCEDVCVDTDGSYMCKCPNISGTEPVELECLGINSDNIFYYNSIIFIIIIDINECLVTDLHDCNIDLFEVCLNLERNYTCICLNGYERNEIGSCTGKYDSYIMLYKVNINDYVVDINECAVSNTSCGPNSDCINQVPGFRCDCHQGYELLDNVTCIGIETL